MKSVVLAVITVGILGGWAIPADAQQKVRRGVFGGEVPRERIASGELEYASMFTLGTLLGIAYSADDPSTYRIEQGVVVFDEERQAVRPAIFAFPSIALLGTPGRSLSAIVPMNLNTAGDAEVGVGLSYGFTLRKSAEIGLSVAGVWSDVVRLTPEQQASFENRQPLADGASQDFRTAARFRIGGGIYIAPII